MSYYKKADVVGNDLVVQARPVAAANGIRMEALWSDYVDYAFRLPRDGMDNREIGQYKIPQRTFIIFRTNDHDRYDRFVARAVRLNVEQREIAVALAGDWHGTAEEFLDTVEAL